MQVNFNFNINIDDRIINFFKKIFGRKRNVVIASLAIFFTGAALYAATIEWTDFQPGETLSASALNKKFNFLKDETIPVGTILAWHKNAATNSQLTLNDRWRECNNALVSDPDSPFNNKRVPNLNNEKRFLRGSNTSGTPQDDAMQRIIGKFQVKASYDGGGNSTSGVVSSTPNGNRHNSTSSGGTLYTFDNAGRYVNGKYTFKTNGNGYGTGETRPINMSVVWIIKIK